MEGSFRAGTVLLHSPTAEVIAYSKKEDAALTPLIEEVEKKDGQGRWDHVKLLSGP